MQSFIGLWSMESAKIKCWKFKLCAYITESKKKKTPEYNSEICTNNNNNKGKNKILLGFSLAHVIEQPNFRIPNHVWPYCLIKQVNKILGIRNSEIWLFDDVSKT